MNSMEHVGFRFALRDQPTASSSARDFVFSAPGESDEGEILMRAFLLDS